MIISGPCFAADAKDDRLFGTMQFITQILNYWMSGFIQPLVLTYTTARIGLHDRSYRARQPDA